MQPQDWNSGEDNPTAGQHPNLGRPDDERADDERADGGRADGGRADGERPDGERPGRALHRPARIEAPGGRLNDARARLARSGRVRLDPGRRAAAAVGLAALAAVVASALWVALDRRHATALTVASPVDSTRRTAFSGTARAGPSAAVAPARSSGVQPSGVGSSGAGSSTAASSAATVVVDVVGKVSKPGVYRLAAGSRVQDALQAAGGVLGGVDGATLNLARVVSDGEQIAVAVAGAPDPGGANATDPGNAGAGPVDLNTATAAQLDTLPGVGPVLAQHILAWRTIHGRFTSVDQLRAVSGIGAAKFADLRPLVTV